MQLYYSVTKKVVYYSSGLHSNRQHTNNRIDYYSVSACVYQGLCGSSLKMWTVSVLLDAHRKWASALKDNELMLTYLR